MVGPGGQSSIPADRSFAKSRRVLRFAAPKGGDKIEAVVLDGTVDADPREDCETVIVHGERGIGCDFCALDTFRNAEVFIEGELTFFACDAFGASQVLPGGGIICTLAHRETPFDMTAEEWSDTREMLERAKSVLDERLSPDGYNLIWNVKPDGGQEVAHVHLHIIPRFHDEPFAGRGARWHLKQAENRRPDPLAQGSGFAVS